MSILNKKIKYYTKKFFKYLNMSVIAFGIIATIILVKYKPIYGISIAGEQLGYIDNKEAFEEKVKENIVGDNKKNVDNISINNNPQYELKLVDRTVETNEEEIAKTVEQDVTVTYKYYEVDLNNEAVDSVDTVEEAEELVNKVKEENNQQNLDLSILEKYTENVEDLKTTTIETAKNNIQTKISQKLAEEEKQKQEQERINRMPSINGIKIAYAPITGIITSRYASVDSVRNYRTHGGLDIAASTGTAIKAIASGRVICASYQSGYGNMVKLDHGSGVQSYYGHCSKLYVSQGEYVEAGKVIAAVGSTGHSTGPHLHLEIRVNGETVNPQKYLYK